MSFITENLSSLKDYLLAFGEMTGALVIGVLIGIISAIRKKNVSFRWTAKKQDVFVQKHGRIHELLTELRLTVRASRCLVFQFHNGGSFSDGSSIKRFSVTHESCDGGVTSMILDSQDVMLTRYVDLIHTMNESSSKILSVGSLSPSSFRSALEINNVEYFSVSVMKESDGIVPFGFVCCHWSSASALDEIEKEGVAQKTLEALIEDSVQNITSYFFTKERTR